MRGQATVQSSKAVEYKTWIASGVNASKDILLDFSGNETDNNAQLIDLSVGYDISKNIRLQGNVNNLLNTYGVLGWSGTGGFAAALNRQGFTKYFVSANPNAVYSTQGSMPRAYFLTMNYKF